MRLIIERKFAEYLSAACAPSLGMLVVCGHSNTERPKPYICVDAASAEPFGGLDSKEGIWEITLSVMLVFDAHKMDYERAFEAAREIRRAMGGALEFFEGDGEFRFESLTLSSDGDGRDDNNIGIVLKYELIAQELTEL